MPRIRHAHAGVVMLVGAAQVLVSCGGGSGDASPTAVPAPPAVAAPASSVCPLGIDSGDITPAVVAAPLCDASRFDVHTDIPYATHADALLDLLIPRSASAPMPLIVWVHGGGWQSGDKTDRAQASRLVCRGFALASINYRLSATQIFPAQIRDVKAAIRFLRANAAMYGLDSQRIGVFGSSAGGHLAALAGVADVATFDDISLGNAGVSSQVQAVVDWYGPTRLVDMDSQLLLQGCPPGSAHHGESDSAESRLLGCTLNDASCAAAAASADPAQYVDAADPPHLILHGTADCVSPAAQSAVYAEALSSGGSCVVHRSVSGAGHGGAPWMSSEVQGAVAQFFERTLAPAAAP